MNTKPLTLVVAALLLTAATSTARAITYKTLDYPGSDSTIARGVDGKNVVGYYIDRSGLEHGFLYNGDSYKSLDDPLAAQGTIALGTSNGNIVGFYESGKDHGFIYNGGSYTTLDDPLTTPTQETHVHGVSGNNFVGVYGDAATGFHGFLYDGTAFSTLDDPQQVPVSTIALGVSGHDVVGSYSDGPEYHGFLYNGSNWTTLDDPLAGAGHDTFAAGISNGNIVGYYADSSETHGFLDIGANYTTLDDPLGTLGTYAVGIDGNDIVGFYIDSSGIEHGFLATVPQPGDFDGNGVVDAADYVVWRKGLGTTNTQADYKVWRAHFGQSAGSGEALPSAEPLSSSVPEPASLILAAFLGVVVFVVRWQRQYGRDFSGCLTLHR